MEYPLDKADPVGPIEGRPQGLMDGGHASAPNVSLVHIRSNGRVAGNVLRMLGPC